MKTGTQILMLTLILALVAGLSLYVGHQWSRKTTNEATVSAVMERMRNIHEMALVETQLSLIYDYKDFWHFDVSPFRKKALILVEGDVKAGFDLDAMGLIWDLENRHVVIDSIPNVEILSVDHNIRYYDIQEGSFNGFTAEELTKLGGGAKKYLRAKAEESDLLIKAENRQKAFFEETKALLEQAGWTVDLRYQNHLLD